MITRGTFGLLTEPLNHLFADNPVHGADLATSVVAGGRWSCHLISPSKPLWPTGRLQVGYPSPWQLLTSGGQVFQVTGSWVLSTDTTHLGVHAVHRYNRRSSIGSEGSDTKMETLFWKAFK